MAGTITGHVVRAFSEGGEPGDELCKFPDVAGKEEPGGLGRHSPRVQEDDSVEANSFAGYVLLPKSHGVRLSFPKTGPGLRAEYPRGGALLFTQSTEGCEVVKQDGSSDNTSPPKSLPSLNSQSTPTTGSHRTISQRTDHVVNVYTYVCDSLVTVCSSAMLETPTGLPFSPQRPAQYPTHRTGVRCVCAALMDVIG